MTGLILCCYHPITLGKVTCKFRHLLSTARGNAMQWCDERMQVATRHDATWCEETTAIATADVTADVMVQEDGHRNETMRRGEQRRDTWCNAMGCNRTRPLQQDGGRQDADMRTMAIAMRQCRHDMDAKITQCNTTKQCELSGKMQRDVTWRDATQQDNSRCG